ncbi:MAG: 16S rRNA (guanine(527)-N(7))-methyltransferase RsmG [Ruminococcus sp.]|nr:16S rRNA (guanine(527)-N(7))-methyltransferase RsmG [Ruminococcus sp.]
MTREYYDRLFEGLGLDDGRYERLREYERLLIEWNERINLTAITAPEEVAVKHFYDSIYPFTLFDLPEGSELIDVGTGAGFPSCPLKIFRNDIKLTLLDSLNKRINFLAALSENIDLGVDCIHGRAEELGRTATYREKYDIACARAVANLRELCEYCLPFVKVGGAFAALKGSAGREELKEAQNAVKTLGGEVSQVTDYTLPTGDGRTLIIIGKVKPTPEKYPRNKGQMKKKPL